MGKSLATHLAHEFEQMMAIAALTGYFNFKIRIGSLIFDLFNDFKCIFNSLIHFRCSYNSITDLFGIMMDIFERFHFAELGKLCRGII
jgi:hypothetical protein